jgi:hypothetical protein
MTALAGRHIYITDLKRMLAGDAPSAFVQRCRRAQLAGVWIRMGRGKGKDPNMTLASLDAVRDQLAFAGIELWGWHVPFCEDREAAKAEAAGVLKLANDARLDGVVVDAERTDNPPRFRGGAAEAEAYLKVLGPGLAQTHKGFAFSSHDQPSLHRDLPFATFLQYIPDVCPQVYFHAADPAPRLAKSIHDYRNLVSAGEFNARYKPTGNITMGSDIGFPSVNACVAATRAFLGLVKANGYASHSFWCWDDAPKEVLAVLAQDPPPAML